MQEMKVCPHCKRVLTLEDFYKLKSDKVDSYCKECRKQRSIQWQRSHKSKRRDHYFWKQYEVTPEQIAELEQRQMRPIELYKKYGLHRSRPACALCHKHPHQLHLTPGPRGWVLCCRACLLEVKAVEKEMRALLGENLPLEIVGFEEEVVESLGKGKLEAQDAV